MIQLFLLAWLAGQAATSDAMRHVQAGLEARQQHNVEQEIAEFRKATGSTRVALLAGQSCLAGRRQRHRREGMVEGGRTRKGHIACCTSTFWASRSVS